MSEFEMICNPVGTENEDENSSVVSEINNGDAENISIYYLFECKNISRIIIHISVHITLLSLLEPLFYFLYVVNMEKDLFFHQIKILINQIVANMNTDMINAILSNPLVNFGITTTLGNDTYLDSYFQDLKTDYIESLDENEKNKNELEEKSYYFSGYCFLFTTFYFILHQCIYQEKYLFWQIMLEHIILVLFIGFYEYWFFNNIVLHYSPWTDQEITYYIVTCTWNKAIKKIPALNMFVKNETSCELK